MRKNAEKIVVVECSFCHKQVIKPKKEVDRRIRDGKNKFYCNNTCSSKENPGILKGQEYSKTHPVETRERLLKLSTNRQDEFSSFKYFIQKTKSKNRTKYGSSDLSLQYLKNLWEKQNGICPYTGYQIELPKNTQDFNKKGSPKKASLDRIDSSKGYVEGNVEFVCLAANWAKNGFTKEQMLDFFQNIKL
jgi:hypothetical protein